jgi:hypothetical protein
MSAPRPLTDLLGVFIGPGLWFAHFGVLYGAEALACVRPSAAPHVLIWIGAIATVATLAALASFAAISMRTQRSEHRPDAHSGAAFLRGVALLLVLLSALGVLWSVFPVAALPVCAPPQG